MVESSRRANTKVKLSDGKDTVIIYRAKLNDEMCGPVALRDGRIVWAERSGLIRSWSGQQDSIDAAATVSTSACAARSFCVALCHPKTAF